MKKGMTIMLVGVAVVGASLFGFNEFKQHMIAKIIASSFKLPVVSTEVVKKQDWQPYLDSVGTLIANEGVMVTPEVAGTITDILFASGDSVNEGDVLIQLFNGTEVASLKSNVANAKLQKINLEREQQLLSRDLTAQQTVDQLAAAYDEATASVEASQVNLELKEVKAPFTGQLGIRLVDLGEYLTPGSSIVSLQNFDELRVQFELSQKDIGKVSINQAVEIETDAYPGRVFKGHVFALDSEVNQNTRTILVEAIIPNEEKMLYPGIFVTVRVLLPVIPDVIVVSQTAVDFSLYGQSTYVVDDIKPASDSKASNNKSSSSSGSSSGSGVLVEQDTLPTGTAKQVFLKTGDRRGDKVIVLSGLKEGETIINAGSSKLSGTAQVSINNANPLSTDNVEMNEANLGLSSE